VARKIEPHGIVPPLGDVQPVKLRRVAAKVNGVCAIIVGLGREVIERIAAALVILLKIALGIVDRD
jgi:hypothetical protein